MVSQKGRKAFWKKCKHGRNTANCALCKTDREKEIDEAVRLEQEFQKKHPNSWLPITQTGNQSGDTTIYERGKTRGPLHDGKTRDGKRIWTCKLCGEGVFNNQKTVDTFDEVYHRECCEPCGHVSRHLIIRRYKICSTCKKQICIKCNHSSCPSSKN